LTTDAGVAVDIVVPVYNAADDLRRCVKSVIARTGSDYRLVLVDDGSTDPAIRSYFAELAARALPQVVLQANTQNLGFTGTANRGMREARPGTDIVLLNSDTVVTTGWLDALTRCVRSDERIGTATPFSNNAEICSLPRFCENNPWPADRDPELMAQALRHAALPTYPDLPTGVGFCLYIRRALIDAIGVFDPAFGRGYGEECDFCMRAAAAGWRNVLCEDAFVLHTGAKSFGGSRAELVARHGALLLERHPQYDALVQDFIAFDSLRPLRELALAQHRLLAQPVPGLLHVVHGQGGGSDSHVRSLVDALGDVHRHYVLVDLGEGCSVEERDRDGVRRFEFSREPGEPLRDFLAGICARFEITLVHLHNVGDRVADAMATLDIPYGCTVHDLAMACPTVTCLDATHAYCGAQTDIDTCRRCLAAQPEFAHIDIADWRESHRRLLAGAAFVIAPSQWAAATLQRYFPGVAIHVVPHAYAPPVPRADAVAQVQAIPDDDRPVVAVLGAIGPDKGSRRLERLVNLTRERGLALRWVLIGYLDRQREPWQSEDGVFAMHGPYDVDRLPALLDAYRVRLVLFPSVCPESFSFTLSEAWRAGRPALVPPIGALAERVAASGAGYVSDPAEWGSDERLLDRIAALASDRHGSLHRMTQRARETVLPTRDAMAASTLALYRQALDVAPSSRAAPIATARCLAALGYRPWRPPVDAPVTAAPASRNTMTRVARAALRIRHTAPGRLLYTLAPRSWLAALKARLE
jgi:GT2 family glycosyltransferase/glycosyltransferase involved in cell wall biosynthesis